MAQQAAPDRPTLPSTTPTMDSLQRLDFTTEYNAIGLTVMRGAGNNGWQQCVSAIDPNAIAMMHPRSGYYHDSLLMPRAIPFPEVLETFWAFEGEPGVRAYLAARANGQNPGLPPRLRRGPDPAADAPQVPTPQVPPETVLPQPPQAEQAPTAPATETSHAVQQPDQASATATPGPAHADLAAEIHADSVAEIAEWIRFFKRLRAAADVFFAALEMESVTIKASNPVDFAAKLAPQFSTESLAKPLNQVSLSEIGLSGAELNLLTRGGVANVAELYDLVRQSTLTTLPKIGKAKADSIADCVRRFDTARNAAAAAQFATPQ